MVQDWCSDLYFISNALLNSPWTICPSTGWMEWQVVIIITVVIITLILSYASTDSVDIHSHVFVIPLFYR